MSVGDKKRTVCLTTRAGLGGVKVTTVGRQAGALDILFASALGFFLAPGSACSRVRLGCAAAGTGTLDLAGVAAPLGGDLVDGPGAGAVHLGGVLRLVEPRAAVVNVLALRLRLGVDGLGVANVGLGGLEVRVARRGGLVRCGAFAPYCLLSGCCGGCSGGVFGGLRSRLCDRRISC